ncbi:D-beta-D-heptose 1-phosphate adenylyltransferase [Advenella faeciporci]|uniref:D-glycero-beta-D-manno-heptose 1-phosphate adenylyltransferase n=1 Tax=Advenella faeciporci TaxID=797535 RepID=A0A918MY84_9BURK|nr:MULTISPECIES: D-glycero-beta-D-manno-heptose 1-phosphate adenylyltransferase [Advenella]WKU19303.1 D-glycero-beta-D-manno-heptose 1-phosphate adenylyltransferase [Advenella alkanexedens]GGW87213.1 D-beta-D-heptose 1-phosphate adenylyltransferase [Advenella faeciporci]
MAIRFEKKILSREQCLQAVEKGQFKRPLVFTNGVFDILHRGHVSYLDQAAQLGATLIVAVNTDESVRRLGKAPDRPLNRQEDRAALLAALSCVTAVTSFSEDTPLELIEQLKPDIIVKGGDYEMEKLPETARVKSWGGKAIAIPFEFERSTTSLVKKIREAGQVPDADS